MFPFIKRYLGRPFVRNVAIIAGGTATAQIIHIGFSPIITRLYGPEIFGVLGVILSVVAIISPISTLCYDHSIVMPAKKADGLLLLKLSIIIALLVSSISCIIFIIFQSWISFRLNIGDAYYLIYFIPIIVFLSAVAQVNEQWLVRTKRFKTTATIGVIKALLVGSSKSGLGLIYPTATTLVSLSSAGHGLHALLTSYGARDTKKDVSISIKNSDGMIENKMKSLAYEYRDFPFFRAPQVFINSISRNLPILMFTSLFGPAVVGYYVIAHRVLKLPAALINASVGKVFVQRIAEASHKGENLKNLIIRTTLGMAAVGIIPFLVIIAFGPWIFGFVFGSEWTVAGDYARWLSLWLFFGFINVPSVTAIPFLKLQKHLLLYEIVAVIARISSISVGAFIYKSDVITIGIFSIMGAVLYVYLILWVIHRSGHTGKSL